MGRQSDQFGQLLQYAIVYKAGMSTAEISCAERSYNKFLRGHLLLYGSKTETPCHKITIGNVQYAEMRLLNNVESLTLFIGVPVHRVVYKSALSQPAECPMGQTASLTH